MQNDSRKPGNETPGWYALRVFYNRTEKLLEDIRGLVTDFYIPSRVISSLMFVRTTPSALERIRQDRFGLLKVYTHPGTSRPCLIPQKEMDVFKFVTSLDDKKLTLLDPGVVKFRRGQKVRVVGGLFKGAEGYIQRIKGNKRLLVSIEGIVTVATSYIPSAYLEKLDED